jgi:hypothetical protein
VVRPRQDYAGNWCSGSPNDCLRRPWGLLQHAPRAAAGGACCLCRTVTRIKPLVIDPGLIPVEIPMAIAARVSFNSYPLINQDETCGPDSASVFDEDMGSFAASSAIAGTDYPASSCFLTAAPVPPMQLSQYYCFEWAPANWLRLVVGFIQPQHAELWRPLHRRIVRVIWVVADHGWWRMRHRKRESKGQVGGNQQGCRRTSNEGDKAKASPNALSYSHGQKHVSLVIAQAA